MLSDPQKRAAYDQYGHAGVDPNMRGPGGAGASAKPADDDNVVDAEVKEVKKG